jgi:hypothetical protein
LFGIVSDVAGEYRQDFSGFTVSADHGDAALVYSFLQRHEDVAHSVVEKPIGPVSEIVFRDICVGYFVRWQVTYQDACMSGRFPPNMTRYVAEDEIDRISRLPSTELC